MLIRRTLDLLFRKFVLAPSRRRDFWKRSYRRFNRRLADRDVVFLDYGFEPDDGPVQLPAPVKDEYRTHAQLYHRVASAVPLAGAAVLEVGCGRGGGAAYVARNLGPRLVVGVDLAEPAVAFASRTHGPAVRFLCGDAGRLPFADRSFDAVVNVESSHCYPSFREFLQEVARVLRPGGHLLYADFRRTGQWPAWREDVAAAGLEVVETEDITSGVVRAMSLNHARKRRLVQEIAPGYMRRLLGEFTGCEGSSIQREFRTNEAQYRRFVLRRP